MDKRRDVRRGASRFNHFKDKLVSGLDSVCSEKSKKGRLRRLNSVDRESVSYEDCEMGCGASEREEDIHNVDSSMRFKLPKKLFYDCNGVNHSSVPRKLRSAMKKRSCESVSPPLLDLKKVNYTRGIESSNMDGAKKLRSCMKQGMDRSLSPTESEIITKDEEEVVETLYALAGMFPDNDSVEKPTLDGEPVEANASTLPESNYSQLVAAEASKDGSSLIFPLPISDAVNPSSSTERLAQTVKEEVENKEEVAEAQDQSALSQNKKLSLKSDDCAPLVNLLSTKSEQCEMKLACDTINFCIPSDLNMYYGVKPPLEKETSILDRKTGIALGMATTNGSQMEQECVVKESKENGLALWPGLQPSTQQSAGTGCPISLQSSGATIPAWLDVPLGASKTTFQNSSSVGKVNEVSASRKSYKSCAAHVYISHLIQTLQISENKGKVSLQKNHKRHHEETKQGALLVANEINGVKNGLSNAVSASSLGSSITEENASAAKSSILPERRFHQDQLPSTLAYGGCNPQKSFEFMSMSAGGGGLHAIDNICKTRPDFEHLSKLQGSYHPSIMQPHTQMSLSLPQSRCSSVYANHLSSGQQQLQPPQFHGNPFYGPQSIPTGMTKQHHLQQPLQQHHLQQPLQQHHLQQPLQQHQLPQQHQQQQQQRIWATQYRSLGTSAGAVQLKNWQNGKQGPPFIPCSEALMSPSPSALEAVGHKYVPLSQQQLMAMSSSFSPGRIIKQDRHLPSNHEEPSRFHAAGPMPLQFFCNERL